MRRFYDDLSDRSAYSRFFGLRPALLDDYLHPPADRTSVAASCSSLSMVVS